MKIFRTIFLTAFIIPFAVSIQAQDNLSQLQMDVAILASDLMEGRETGTKGEKMAAGYIATRFEEMGLIPMGQNGSWYHTFDFKFSTNPHAAANEKEDRTGKNVVAFIDNKASHTVVIGAHYDHLGYGSFGSLHRGDPAIHNGADDNASGVAMVLQLAERLKTSEYGQNNYLFIAFSGEELGLFGSKFYVEDPTLAIDQMTYMINLDMVGRLNEEKVVLINGVGTSPNWKTAIDHIDHNGLSIKTTESGIGGSDHTSFYNKGVPAVHFFTGQHQDYHKPIDDAHLLNYEGMEQVTDFIMELIKELNTIGKLEFTKTKDQNDGRRASSFKVTMGVMPDYTYSGEGMKIDGVNDGRPAANAGIEGGDVLIKVDDIDIKDIYDYMDILGKYEKGQKAKIKVKRGDKKLTLDLTF